MKKGDIAVIFIMIFIIALSAVWVSAGNDVKGNLKCIIKVNGEIFKEIKLKENYNNFIEINSPFGYNKISIEGNNVKMVESDCEDSLCLKEKPISHPHESLICLPGRLVVYIEGESELHYVSY